MSIDRFLLRMPKVELHVHLEGSMRPAVLLELARRNGLELPAADEAGLKRWFRFRDFEHFVEVYLAVVALIRPITWPFFTFEPTLTGSEVSVPLVAKVGDSVSAVEMLPEADTLEETVPRVTATVRATPLEAADDVP